MTTQNTKLLSLTAVLALLLLVGCEPPNDFGPENWAHFVRKDSAQIWINRYDAKLFSADGRRDSNNLRLLSYADDFDQGKWMMGTMMSRKEATGFRVYYGIKSNDSIVPILVGIDKDGNDLYWNKPVSVAVAAQAGGTGSTELGALDMSRKPPPPPPARVIRTVMIPSRWERPGQNNQNR